MVQPASVTLEGMKAAQGHFQNALEQVNTAYTNMSEQQGTLAANWTGEASSSFGRALTTWLDDLGIVRSQLILILEKLAANTGVYTNTNEGSSQMANAFLQGLPGLAGL